MTIYNALLRLVILTTAASLPTIMHGMEKNHPNQAKTAVALLNTMDEPKSSPESSPNMTVGELKKRLLKHRGHDNPLKAICNAFSRWLCDKKEIPLFLPYVVPCAMLLSETPDHNILLADRIDELIKGIPQPEYYSRDGSTLFLEWAGTLINRDLLAICNQTAIKDGPSKKQPTRLKPPKALRIPMPGLSRGIKRGRPPGTRSLDRLFEQFCNETGYAGAFCPKKPGRPINEWKEWLQEKGISLASTFQKKTQCRSNNSSRKRKRAQPLETPSTDPLVEQFLIQTGYKGSFNSGRGRPPNSWREWLKKQTISPSSNPPLLVDPLMTPSSSSVSKTAQHSPTVWHASASRKQEDNAVGCVNDLFKWQSQGDPLMLLDPSDDA